MTKQKKNTTIGIMVDRSENNTNIGMQVHGVLSQEDLCKVAVTLIDFIDREFPLNDEPVVSAMMEIAGMEDRYDFLRAYSHTISSEVHEYDLKKED